MALFSFFIYLIIKKHLLNIIRFRYNIKSVPNKLGTLFIFLSSKFNYSADSSFAAFSEDFF